MMKIIPGWNPITKEIKLAENPLHSPVQQKSFSDMLHHQDEKSSQEKLMKFMEQIDKQGERLMKSMTVRELRQYKLLIKQFLEETARRGVGLKDTKGWDRRGRGKRYKLLEEVDRKLLNMVDDMLENEQGKIELLNKVGEIRGLLINLFF